MKTNTTVEYAKKRTRDHIARFDYLYRALDGQLHAGRADRARSSRSATTSSRSSTTGSIGSRSARASRFAGCAGPG